MVNYKTYAGGDLTLGSYIELHRRNSQLITATGAEKLRVTDQLQSYDAIIAQLALRVNAARGFVETPEVKRLDDERDSTQKYCYWSVIYASELPLTSALYAAGNELRVVAKPYKSIAHHELTRQTTETAGFVRDMKAHAEALATLGLTTAVNELEAINNTLAEKMGMREITQGDRTTDRGDQTTDQLRKQVTALLEAMAMRINAAAIYLENDPTIPKLISDLNGVADHYRQIAAQSSGKGSGSSSGGNGGGDTPTPTPTPDDQGGDDDGPSGGEGDTSGDDDGPSGGEGDTSGDDDGPSGGDGDSSGDGGMDQN